ncbi:MAG: ribonuclease III [Acetatifactor sp.]|nr:ribonuclease III [Acetatifactor sp.]
MEKSLILETFNLKEQDIRTFSGLTLAYVGDAVYDLIIRTFVTEQGARSVNALNKMKVRYVNAKAQSDIITALLDELTEEETDVYKRGKNSKPQSTAKNATLSDYHRATGFEALVGYLYLTGQTDRLMYLVKKGVETIG